MIGVSMLWYQLSVCMSACMPIYIFLCRMSTLAVALFSVNLSCLHWCCVIVTGLFLSLLFILEKRKDNDSSILNSVVWLSCQNLQPCVFFSFFVRRSNCFVKPKWKAGKWKAYFLLKTTSTMCDTCWRHFGACKCS